MTQPERLRRHARVLLLVIPWLAACSSAASTAPDSGAGGTGGGGPEAGVEIPDGSQTLADLAPPPADHAPLIDVAQDLPGQMPDGQPACNGSSQSRHYQTAGCGSAAPAPVCGIAAMDLCLRGYLCTCEGKLVGNCDGWGPEPWAYFVQLNAANYNDEGKPCDPLHPPVGSGP
jgi:hypothetical protein